MGTTLTELNNTMKRIEALLEQDAERKTVIGLATRRVPPTTVDLTSTNNLLTSIVNLLTTIDTDTGALVIDLAAIEIINTEIEAETQQTRVNVDNTGGKSIADWLSDAESSLNTLVAENAANFVLNIAEIAVQGAAIIVAVVANAVSIVASVAIGNARLSDIKTAVEAIDVNTDGIETGLQDIETLLGTIDTDTGNIASSLDEIESVLEDVNEAAGGILTGSIPTGNSDFQVSVDTAKYGKILAIRVTNNHASTPTVISTHYSDGTSLIPVTKIAGMVVAQTGGVNQEDIDLEIRSDSFIRFQSSTVADANEIDFEIVVHGDPADFNLSSPT